MTIPIPEARPARYPAYAMTAKNTEATIASGVIGLLGVPNEGIVAGFAIAVLVGVFAYTAVFILLSVATSRALLIGLGYVFIWEGLITELFSGARYLSIRQYCLGIADSIASVSSQDFDATVGGPAGQLVAVRELQLA